MTCRSRLAGFFLDKSKTTPSVSMTCRTKAPLLFLKQRKKEVKPWSYMSLTRSYWQFSQRENIYLVSSSHSPWDGIAYCVSSWQTKLKGLFKKIRVKEAPWSLPSACSSAPNDYTWPLIYCPSVSPSPSKLQACGLLDAPSHAKRQQNRIQTLQFSATFFHPTKQSMRTSMARRSFHFQAFFFAATGEWWR